MGHTDITEASIEFHQHDSSPEWSISCSSLIKPLTAFSSHAINRRI